MTQGSRPPLPGRPTVAVVGGGPGGLMAAEVLATAGAAVTVFERMPSVGRKFQLAGRGGLNITHSEPLPVLLDRYRDARSWLAPAIENFGPAALREWCAGLGQPTFVGSSGRVFPADFRATSLLRAWLGRLGSLGVDLRVRHTWRGWSDGPGPSDRSLLFADPAGASIAFGAMATVFALGGASWPRVGSDGGWVGPMRDAGVEVVALRPANCGFTVSWSESFADRFAGAPLKNISLSFGPGDAVRGEALITRNGIEGGAVYAISGPLRDAIAVGGPAVVHADLRPDVPADDLAERLTRSRPKDTTSAALRRGGFTPLAVALMREAFGGPLPRDGAALAALAKALPIRVLAPQSLERAISTAGGIARSEVDATFMLRKRPGTFVAGEMLDWEAPTGGYLLQATFSTAVAAASAAVEWLGRGSP